VEGVGSVITIPVGEIGRGDEIRPARMIRCLTMAKTEQLSGALAETEAWIDDLALRLGWHERGKVYAALLGTLHALRDSLMRDEAVYVGSQMPALLRGLYYEGWHPAGRAAAKSRAPFLERIHEAVHRDPGIDAEEVARTVLALLAARLPPGELEDAKAATPKPLHFLWPS
jgi:uncharacterized protein (DUF2267 family)